MRTFSIDYGSKELKISTQVKKTVNSITFPLSDDASGLIDSSFVYGFI